MYLILKWIISAIAIIFTGYLVKGVHVESLWTALWLSLFLGIVNLVLRPILVILTLPINIITLGLFTFVINASLVLLAQSVIKGFQVDGFWVAMLFSIVLSIVNYIINAILKTK